MPNRDDFEERRLDQIEEAKIAVYDHQIRLQGVWLKGSTEGCPHLIRKGDGWSVCELNTKFCSYDVDGSGVKSCETFQGIIKEWEAELEPDKAYAMRD